MVSSKVSLQNCGSDLHSCMSRSWRFISNKLANTKDATMHKWLEEVSVEPFSKRNPQISNDLQLEPQAFPHTEAESVDSEMITVSKAYLQRLFDLAKAQEGMKP